MSWDEKRAGIVAWLERIIRTESWDEIPALVDSYFFALSVTDSALLKRMWRSVPMDWIAKHPRYLAAAAIARSGQTGHRIIPGQAQARFEAWVGTQTRPASRDLLSVLNMRMGRALTSGQFTRAVKLADDSDRIIAEAADTDGFDDVLPPALVRNGVSHLLAGDFPKALGHFAEAWRWATRVSPHPFARIAVGYRALSLTLMQDFREAQRWLGTIQPLPEYRPSVAGMLAQTIIHISNLDRPSADESMTELRDIHEDELWWVVVHVKARYALHWGDRDEAIELIERELSSNPRLSHPGSAAGLALRADLSDLYQAIGALRSAARVASVVTVPDQHPILVATRARLKIEQGRLQEAIIDLDEAVRMAASHGVGTPARWAVLRLTAFGRLEGYSAHREIDRVAAFVERRAARSALFEADAVTRDALAVRLQIDPGASALCYQYQEDPGLTEREKETLELLAEHTSIDKLAIAMHISKNTVKTHLQRLYRKLGVGSRKEALEIARPLHSAVQGDRQGDSGGYIRDDNLRSPLAGALTSD